jgi:hypothetical protein
MEQSRQPRVLCVISVWEARCGEDHHVVSDLLSLELATEGGHSSAVIDCLQDASHGEPRVAAISIYSDHADRDKQTGLAMIGALIKQLIRWAQTVPTPVLDLFRQRDKEQRSMDEEDARKIFGLILDQFDTIYICIDALDECALETRAQLLRFLKAIHSPSVRLFLTGRHTIEAEVTGTLSSLSPTIVPIIAAEEDLRIYLSQKLESDRSPEIMNENLKNQIMEKLVEKSEGL